MDGSPRTESGDARTHQRQLVYILYDFTIKGGLTDNLFAARSHFEKLSDAIVRVEYPDPGSWIKGRSGAISCSRNCKRPSMSLLMWIGRTRTSATKSDTLSVVATEIPKSSRPSLH